MKYKIPNWSRLRFLGQSKPVKMTMFIPFIGYVILFNSYVVTFINSSFYFFDNSEAQLPIGSNLYFIYFGLCFLGIATFIFQIMCPTLIKDYQSVRDYVSSNLEYMTPHRLGGLCNHIINISREKHEVVLKAENSISNKVNMDLKNSYIDILQHFWNFSVWSNSVARIMICILYFVGFSCLSIPSFTMLLKVLHSM